jgi:hypothetical protein
VELLEKAVTALSENTRKRERERERWAEKLK